MKFEFEQVGEQLIKKVSIVPSIEGGSFRVIHDYYGERIVSRIGLAGISGSVAEQIESGDISADVLFNVNEDNTVTFDRRRMDCGTVTFSHPGSGNSTGAAISSFVELAPAPLKFEIAAQ